MNYFEHKLLPIPFFRPDKTLPAPYTTDMMGNAGWDLHVTEEIWIQPGEIIKVPLNIHLAIPAGYYGRVTPRSGLSSEGINVIPGTVDSNYRGQVRAITQNISNEVFCIEKGMRIAQLIIMKHEIPHWEEVEDIDELGTTNRGQQGFNSSGLY